MVAIRQRPFLTFQELVNLPATAVLLYDHGPTEPVFYEPTAGVVRVKDARPAIDGEAGGRWDAIRPWKTHAALKRAMPRDASIIDLPDRQPEQLFLAHRPCAIDGGQLRAVEVFTPMDYRREIVGEGLDRHACFNPEPRERGREVMVMAVEELRWERPKCPTKRQGRRGTRKRWKRANQPAFRHTGNVELKRFVPLAGRAHFLDDKELADIREIEARRFYHSHDVVSEYGLLKVRVTWARQRLAEQFMSAFGGKTHSVLGFTSYNDVEEIIVRDESDLLSLEASFWR